MAQYIEQFNAGSRVPAPEVETDWVPWIFMWDEVSVASLLDPSIITDQREMYIDVDVDRGPNYGSTLAWETRQGEKPGLRKMWVQFDLDLERFYDLYAELMMRQSKPGE